MTKPDGHAPYLKTYLAYIVSLFFVNLFFWLPCAIAGGVLSKVIGISPQTTGVLLQTGVNIFFGYFIFRGVIRSDILKIPSAGVSPEQENEVHRTTE